jgi:fused signal recognition particle receptor
MASGSGSNFEALVHACNGGTLPAQVSLLVVNNPGCGAQARAARLNVPCVVHDHRLAPSREALDEQLSASFRAAAVDQLKIWSERAEVPIVTQGMNADPASVAFDTLESAISQNADVVLIDTAGRLHNKVNLMNELSKIRRVMQKLIPDAPHEVLLVLDGSTGQNAIEQARQFTKATEVNALALTKIDGTAKGGVVIGISDEFKIPVKYIGVGEGMYDLQVFNKYEFVDSLFSTEQ